MSKLNDLSNFDRISLSQIPFPGKFVSGKQPLPMIFHRVGVDIQNLIFPVPPQPNFKGGGGTFEFPFKPLQELITKVQTDVYYIVLISLIQLKLIKVCYNFLTPCINLLNLHKILYKLGPAKGFGDRSPSHPFLLTSLIVYLVYVCSGVFSLKINLESKD